MSLDSGSNTSIAPSSEPVANNNTVLVQWAIPLFAGFAVDSKVREAIALEDKSRSDLENARRVAAQGARQAFLGVNSGLAQVRALEAAEISSQSALESNRLGYQVGVRINIDVLNAQQQLFSTRRDLAKARYDTVVNGLRLKSAAGTLKEDDLIQVNSLLSQ
jgi:outer membrane protein